MKLVLNVLNNIQQNEKVIINAAQATGGKIGKKLSEIHFKSPVDPKYFQSITGIIKKTTPLVQSTQKTTSQAASTPMADFKALGFIKNSPLLQLYQKACNSEFQNPYLEKINVLDGISYKDAVELEKIAQKIEEKLKKERCPRMSERLKSLLDLYYLNPDAYNYAMKSDTLVEQFFKQNFSSKECIRNLTEASLKEIEAGIKTPITRLYVENSDSFIKNRENVGELRKLLSEHKISSEILVKRAERETGMFDGILLDDKGLCTKIKLANAVSQIKTKKATFSGFVRSYYKAAQESKLTIYEYIKGKKDLTLADAMLMMPYLDEKTRKAVLDKITGTVIYDERFKSTTFSDAFPRKWLLCRNSQAKIINSITLEKGTEGRYIDVFEPKSFGSSQCEFLLNDTKKQITVTGATYDPETNIFNISSRLKNM